MNQLNQIDRLNKGMDGGGATDFDLSGKDGKYNNFPINSLNVGQLSLADTNLHIFSILASNFCGRTI